ADTIWLFHGFTAHFVLGNCDMERLSLQQAIYGIGGSLHEPFCQLALEQGKIAWVHGDNHPLLNELEHSGQYDLLFPRHTHRGDARWSGPTRVINPGALHRANPKTFVIVNLPDGEVESVTVE